MEAYSHAIGALNAVARPEAEGTEVPQLAAWLLPNFLTVVFAVTLWQVLFFSAGTPRLFHDSDTGWHVRSGEMILARSKVPHTDTFSYTRSGGTWFAWEWLSDTAFGAAHRLAGLAGVALIAAMAIALSACAAARLALSFGGNLFLTAGAAVLMLGVTSMHWLARPHLFSWILALVFLSVAEQERREATWKLYLLPAAAALWANLHASFLLGPAILFIYAVGAWMSHHSPRRFLAASLLSLLATFINPYGWRLHEHVFSYLQSDYLMDHIEEFRSFSFHSAGALYVELFLAAAAVGTMALLRQRAFAPALLCLGMLHVSLYSARHLPTAAVLLLPLSVVALTKEAKSWPGLKRFLDYSDRLQAIDRRIYGLIPVALVLVLTLLGLNALANAGRVSFDAGTFPVHAADFLDKNSLGRGPERVFSTDQWGGYLIYRFGGNVKVFVDGRSDFYGQNVLEAYNRVIAVKPGWDTVLKQYDVRFVLVPTDSPLSSVLQTNQGWRRIYSDTVGTVYERIG